MKATLPVVLALALLGGCAASGSRHGDGSQASSPEATVAREIVQKGDQAMLAGDPRSAAFLYEEAMALEDSAFVWLRIGRAYEQLGEDAKAQAAYAEVTHREPDNAIAYQQVALMYLDKRMLEPATANFKRALDHDRSLWRSWNGLAVAADLSAAYDEARDHYNRALDLRPEVPMLWNNYGYSRYLAGDYHSAEQAFREAIQWDDRYQPAWINLSLLHARRGGYAEAVRTLSRFQPAAVAHNDVGYIALLNGDRSAARLLLQRAIDLSPSYYEAANRNLERLETEHSATVLESLSAAPPKPGPASEPAPRWRISASPPSIGACDGTTGDDPCMAPPKLPETTGG
jgi:Tfp pilus assembly protein PilF